MFYFVPGLDDYGSELAMSDLEGENDFDGSCWPKVIPRSSARVAGPPNSPPTLTIPTSSPSNIYCHLVLFLHSPTIIGTRFAAKFQNSASLSLTPLLILAILFVLCVLLLRAVCERCVVMDTQRVKRTHMLCYKNAGQNSTACRSCCYRPLHLASVEAKTCCCYSSRTHHAGRRGDNQTTTTTNTTCARYNNGMTHTETHVSCHYYRCALWWCCCCLIVVAGMVWGRCC